MSDHNIWPSLRYDDPRAARAWLAALGFEPGILVPGETEGEIHHSEMLWPEGGRVMVTTAAKTAGDVPGSAGVYVVTAHPDDVAERATALAAEFTRPLRDESDYESRGFTIRDPEGNIWSFGTFAG